MQQLFRSLCLAFGRPMGFRQKGSNPVQRVQNIIWRCLLVVGILAVGVGIGLLTWYFTSGTVHEEAPVSIVVPETEAELPENPVDFDTLRQQYQNQDIYAWLYVPGTSVNYPVVQPYTEDDNFYLDHNLQKGYEFAGSIFTQKLNSRTFTDPVTVIYGHNMLNGTMFRTLHSFQDATFFEEHSEFYIYTEGHMLTYQIFAAYNYDNRHILNSFNFSDPAVYQSYLDYALNPTNSTKRNVRSGVTLTTEDRIVVLSTCIGNSEQRYLVQGVLMDDTETK